jgi:hypothetical protein
LKPLLRSNTRENKLLFDSKATADFFARVQEREREIEREREGEREKERKREKEREQERERLREKERERGREGERKREREKERKRERERERERERGREKRFCNASAHFFNTHTHSLSLVHTHAHCKMKEQTHLLPTLCVVLGTIIVVVVKSRFVMQEDYRKRFNLLFQTSFSVSAPDLSFFLLAH